MEVQTLTDSINNVSQIIHIADVHIRNLKRHKEYKDVFDELFTQIDKVNKPGTLIVVAGDIAHAKTDMSPELIDLIGYLFRGFIARAVTIVIPGNHDANLNNKDRLDALSPIITCINDERLFFLRDTGIFRVANVGFAHFSCLSPATSYPGASKVSFEGLEHRIALYHGPVNHSITDQGFVVEGRAVDVDAFEGYDLALLGDIHKLQYLNPEKTIAYPGSLIQQNHGESAEGHGFLVWDMETYESTFIPVYNAYGHHTVTIHNGKIYGEEGMPQRPRLRVRVVNTTSADLKRAVARLRRKYQVQDLVVARAAEEHNAKNNPTQILTRGSITDVSYQNKLIKTFLDTQGVEDEVVDRVILLNKEINTKVDTAEVVQRGSIWKPKLFEFSNMFSYGGENIIDFTSLSGVVGVFAPNASGKSSIFDAMVYCLFDKSTRASKAGEVMNRQKQDFFCRLTLEINGIDYVIERRASPAPYGIDKTRVDVAFWCIEEDGTTVSLNGVDRRSTNQNIRNYIGTYEDFIMTSLSVQNNNTLFIDLPQRERKDLLAQFMGLEHFDKLYMIANDEAKEVQGMLRGLRKDDLDKRLAAAETKLDLTSDEAQAQEAAISQYRADLDHIQSEIVAIAQQIQNVPGDLLDLTKLEIAKQKADAKVELSGKRLIEINSSIETHLAIASDLDMKLDGFAVEESRIKYDLYSKKLIELEKLRTDYKTQQTIQSHIEEKVQVYEPRTYNPDCEFCLTRNQEDNERWNNAKKQLEEHVRVMSPIQEKGKVLHAECVELKPSADEYEKVILPLITAKASAEDTVRSFEFRRREITLEIQEARHALLEAESKVEQHYRVKSIIEENSKLQDRAKEYTDSKSSLLKAISSVEDALRRLHAEERVLEKEIENVKQSLIQLEELELQQKSFEMYLTAVKRDGVPYELVSEALPLIESEVNAMLSQIVSFAVMMEVDGKNINAYIVYDEDNSWPLELCSGMEKFVAGLAIRIALMNVSSLPRPSYIAIDEGWGTLDQDNLSSVHLLLGYLKDQFDHVFVISHLDAMRDVVDQSLDIKKADGFSKVVA